MKKPYVEIVNRQKVFEQTEALTKLIEKTVAAVLKSENIEPKCEVCVQLVNNRQQRVLNSDMRGISKTTDVLSFPSGEFSAGSGEKEIFLGDISLNLERAEKQRKMYGHSFEREVAFLIAHSCLHLLGYDHMVPEDEKTMFEKQEDILNKIGMKR